MENQYDIIVNKLDSFIKKFYKNKIIKGLILSVVLMSFLSVVTSVIEFFGHYSIQVRTTIFYSLIALTIFIVGYYIIIPILKLLKIGKVIDYKQATKIVSEHFTEIQDKLLNILELNQLYNSGNNNDLIIASINQKTDKIKPIQFQNVVNFKENLKYLKYLVLILFSIVLISFVSPSIFSEGGIRVMNYDKYYAPFVPYEFIVLNDSLNVQKGKNFTIKLRVKGKYIPEGVFVKFGGNSFKMLNSKNSKTDFIYELKNINNSIDFKIYAEEIESKLYKINVLPAPVILNFSVEIKPPSYTGEIAKQLKNNGDLIIPYGTKVTWLFKTQSVDTIEIEFTEKDKSKKSINENKIFEFNKQILKGGKYTVNVKNKYFFINQLLTYTIKVVPDLYPEIDVKSLIDSTNKTLYYYYGNISDDYGIRKLKFNYKIVKTDKSQENDILDFKTKKISLRNKQNSQEFYYSMEFSKIKKQENENIYYYFEVWDNDAVSGSKSTKSKMFYFKTPSLTELQNIENQTNKSIKSKIEESINIADELKKEINELKRRSNSENLSEWDKRKMLKSITDKQNILEELLKQISLENKKKNDLINSFGEKQKDLIDKQKQIQKLLDELLTDELKDLLKQIEKLQEKFNKNKFNKLNKDLEFSYDDMKKQLDRNLELLKRYEVEKKINNTIDELKELSKQQDKLSEKIKNKTGRKSDIQNEQKEQKEKFDKLMENYKKNIEKNKKLKAPFNINKFEKEKKSIKESFNKASENINKSKMKKAGKEQKSNSQKLSKLAKKMQNMLDKNLQMQNMLNMENIKQILDNLVKFSFDQEDVMKKLKKIYSNNPKYSKLNVQQQKLENDFKIINDSLESLAKKTPQLSTPINKELKSINQNLSKISSEIESGRRRSSLSLQQFVMMSTNNLALLLEEVLEQMKNMMKNAQAGGNTGNNSKKKPSKSSFGSLKKQQQQLKKQMEQMLNQMKNGKLSKNAQNKRLVEMLEKQEMFDQMLNDLMNKTNLSPKTQKILNQIKKMSEKNQHDIIEKRFDRNTLHRNKKILTRLLDAEKSKNERGFEKKRESKEANDKNIKRPEDYFKNKKDKKGLNEELIKNNIKLYNFYKLKYENYIKKIIGK